MEKNTSTYTEMYEGKLLIVMSANMPPEPDYEPIYYQNGIGYEITGTHKLAQDKPTVTVRIPAAKLDLRDYSPAVAAYCYREFRKYIDELNELIYNRSRPDKENGKYILPPSAGAVVPNNYAFFASVLNKWYENGGGINVYPLLGDDAPGKEMTLHLRIQVQLPAKRLKKALLMLCDYLPDAVERFVMEFDREGLEEVRRCAEKQTAIRAWLKGSDYCAFLADGSILPRSKGTDLPMKNAVPFRSAPEDEIEICGVRGMGVKKGVTVITGGGYSGKSTVLDAISAGIYDHLPGDGRELCITDESAFTIAAEDGRSVKHVNISPFIKWLPGGDTTDFSTEHASGSTSQAANIMEAVDCGARLLLIDEDRSATNFMIRDRLMKELIEKEPITPFTDRVNELYREKGVSTILVIGGSGEYLSVADRVYRMDEYRISDITRKAKDICVSYGVVPGIPVKADWKQSRILYSDRFSPYPEGCGSERLEVSEMGFIRIGDEWIDVRGLHDIVSRSQLDALGFLLRYLMITNDETVIDLDRKLDELYGKIGEEGVDILYSSFFTTTERFLVLPRRQEVMALVNRMRLIRYEKKKNPVCQPLVDRTSKP